MKILILLSKDTQSLLDYTKTFKNVEYFPENDVHPKQLFFSLTELLQGMSYGEITLVTHSKDVVNIIGDLIEDNEINHEDVEIRIVDKDFVKTYQYDEEGDLVDWEIGFFSYQ